MELHCVVLLILVWGAYGEEDGAYDPTFEYHYDVLMKQVQIEDRLSKLEDSDTALRRRNSVLTDKLEGALETIDSLNDTIEVLKSQHTGGGATYIRWGRTTCPDSSGAVLVYEGYAAGSYFKHPGGGANYLCLPKQPIWGQYNDLRQVQGLLYGAEYQMSGPLSQHDVPCAVCRIPRTNVLMIPGRNVCYSGWTLEYSGDLVSGQYLHLHTAEYVCLGANPEVVTGGNLTRTGALFYYVEGRCGSLKCPPYVNGRELSCAVCSYSPFQEQTSLHPYD